jgi:branched-chain amino acid transport system ATP-binding protein
VKDHSLLLETKNLSLRFGGVVATDDLSITIQKGKVTAMIGPNGAGKTTVLNIISGFLVPDAGEIWYKGVNIEGLSPVKILKMGLARTFQELRLFQRLRVIDNVLLGLQNREEENPIVALMRGRFPTENKQHMDRAFELLEFCDLTEKAGELVANLSYGEQKLTALARTLATGANLILLDEPSSGLLPAVIEERICPLIRRIVDNGTTVLLVDHNMEVVMNVSDTVIALVVGKKIAEGTPSEIRKHSEVIKVYLGAA